MKTNRMIAWKKIRKEFEKSNENPSDYEILTTLKLELSMLKTVNEINC